MIKRKVTSYSEVDFPDRCTQQCYFRDAFMAYVADMKPDALRDLLNEPFDLYHKLPSRPFSVDIFEMVSESPDVWVLIESIQRWGAKYHLNALWCYETAVKTIRECNYTRCEEVREEEGQRVQMLHGRRYVFSPHTVKSFASLGVD